MAVEPYPDQLEPPNPEVVIWRYMKMARFADLIKTGELYFCRADLFNRAWGCADPQLADDAEQHIGLFPRWAVICDPNGYHAELRQWFR